MSGWKQLIGFMDAHGLFEHPKIKDVFGYLINALFLAEKMHKNHRIGERDDLAIHFADLISGGRALEEHHRMNNEPILIAIYESGIRTVIVMSGFVESL